MRTTCRVKRHPTPKRTGKQNSCQNKKEFTSEKTRENRLEEPVVVEFTEAVGMFSQVNDYVKESPPHGFFVIVAQV